MTDRERGECVKRFITNIRNEDDPHYDEDAAMCECGHTFRDHWGRAFSYHCAEAGCGCRGFQGEPGNG